MVEGRHISGCGICYEQEAAGGQTDRIWSNQAWLDGWLNPERLTIEQFKARAATGDFRHPGPEYVELNIGNLCNLKCRMCGGLSSSRIERDPVHTPWVEEQMRTLPRSAETSWWQDRSALDRIFQYPERVQHVYLLGGEPLLIKEISGILQYLIDRGVAAGIDVITTTNGTTTKAPWLPLTRHFRALCLDFSLDGYGQLNDYMRYPSRWDNLVRNIEYFKALPNVYLTAICVLQAYNALNVVELLRFLDALGVGIKVGWVYTPEYLRLRALPPHVCREAARRLRAYAEADCLPANKELIHATAASLESAVQQFDPDLLRQFMLFTNDLDVTRGQSFRESCAELHQMIEAAGFAWTDETLHAGRRPLPAV